MRLPTKGQLGSAGGLKTSKCLNYLHHPKSLEYSNMPNRRFRLTSKVKYFVHCFNAPIFIY